MRLGKWLFAASAIFVSNIFAPVSQAAFPDHTVRFLVPYAAGGATDYITRVLATKLSEKWGQSVIVENKPGGEGTIAPNEVAHAAPDGYTFILITSNHTVPSDRPLPYDQIKSFAPITNVAYVPNVMVINPSIPANSLKEFIALAKAKPGALNYASTGVNSSQYLDLQYFMSLAGIKMQSVTYSGGATALVALLGNEVQMFSCPIPNCIENIKAGKFRPLAVAGEQRSSFLPDVPTFKEAAELPGYVGSNNWHGILAPAGTPPDIVKKLHDDFVSVIKSQEIADKLTKQGFVVVADSPDEFRKTIVDDIERWKSLKEKLKAQ